MQIGMTVIVLGIERYKFTPKEAGAKELDVAKISYITPGRQDRDLNRGIFPATRQKCSPLIHEKLSNSVPCVANLMLGAGGAGDGATLMPIDAEFVAGVERVKLTPTGFDVLPEVPTATKRPA